MGRTELLILILTALFANAATGQERFITIDGRKVWVKTQDLDIRAEGQPLLVFESGLGTPMDHWNKIEEGVGELAPFLMYDRPGIGKSEADDQLPTIQNVSDHLLRILDYLNQPPPYILIGHSLGGLYVRGFAVYHPEKLAGLVIIDPADFTETQVNKRDYYKVFGWSEERIDSMVQGQEKKLSNRSSEAPLSIREESQVLTEIRKSDFQIITDNPLPNIPVHMIIGGRFDYPAHLHSKEYNEKIFFRSKMKYRMSRWMEVINSVDKGMLLYSTDAGHFVHYDDPELVISSVKIVLQDYANMLVKNNNSK